MKRVYNIALIALTAIILAVATAACTSIEEPQEESIVGYWQAADGSEICFRDNGTGYTKELNDEGDIDKNKFDYEISHAADGNLTVVITWSNDNPPAIVTAIVTDSTLTLIPGKTYTRKPQ